MDIYSYREEGVPLILLAGKDYGCGSSRDWAAKGPFLLGIKAVIAESYERIHRSNLVGMGIIPLQFLPGQSALSLGLSGRETYNISIPEGGIKPGQLMDVEVILFQTWKKILRLIMKILVPTKLYLNCGESCCIFV